MVAPEPIRTVSVVGLGKLGACLAACLASRGFDVIGVDTDARAVEDVRNNRAPVVEPGLDELMVAGRDRLSATTSYEDAVGVSDATFIVVPTPSRPDGLFATDRVVASVEGVGRALARTGPRYHLVVLVSTVLPRDTRGVIVPALERAAGRTIGDALGVCYNPEFIALGDAVRGMLEPELVLIGESDERAGATLAGIYQRLSTGRPRVVRTNFENAELAKIALNVFVTMKIDFANILAEICERLPGGNVDAVTAALGADGRIGPRYLRGGLGYGGPCFPRDDVAFATFARLVGVSAALPEATHGHNASIPGRVAALVRERCRAGATVAILGVAYKPNTPVVESSQALDIARALVPDHRIRLYDPLARLAPDDARGPFELLRDPRAAIEGASCIVVANPLPELRALGSWLAEANGLTVIDCWRFLPELATRPGLNYVGIGLG